MTLPKHYLSQEIEPALTAAWLAAGIFHFDPSSPRPVYSIDTPPPTVSGHLHLGHIYSYSHADFIARFWRMNGRNVYYPMGYDDNGLPTERLVEKRLGQRATRLGRTAFIQKCLETSEQVEQEYQALWQRLGLSIDWRYTYRTIEPRARRLAQQSFLELYAQGLAYRQQAPTVWCPECQTALAQADLNDLELTSEFITLAFQKTDGTSLPIATTRPELLPACVAVFVHPDDPRYAYLAGQQVRVPLFGQQVPALTDPAADPDKGTGVVMCCTFGDATDVNWWRTHRLPLIEAIGKDGRLTSAAGAYAGQLSLSGRQQIVTDLQHAGLVLERKPLSHAVRVHERCDTPVEYLVTPQWFIRTLDFKAELLKAGAQVHWRPPHMQARYQAWVENLNQDWCISRQRFFGIPFPVWYCRACGAVMTADPGTLPVDPSEQSPDRPCACGSQDFFPEQDVLDTWATSSLTPQIAGQAASLDPADPENALYRQVSPFSLRPQAHEIIRTWAFYTILKSQLHFQELPWTDVLISGWGIAGEGMGKISKSRGGGPMAPMEMIQRYSADAVRYWAASTAPGRDAIISEEKIQLGARLVTKLWNVGRFSERFVSDPQLAGSLPLEAAQALTPADRWILASLQQLIRRVTAHFEGYDYAAAKAESESYFWSALADNYLEMAKQRLYGQPGPTQTAACWTLRQAFLAGLKLLAPVLPFITDELYLALFQASEGAASIHVAPWPRPDPSWEDPAALAFGQTLVEIASAVRRYKSEHNLSLGKEFAGLALVPAGEVQAGALAAAFPDLQSVCRANQVTLEAGLNPGWEALPLDPASCGALQAALLTET